MGHALGLSHSDGNGYSSIMKKGTADYFDKDKDKACSSAPTSGDKKLLKAKYG